MEENSSFIRQNIFGIIGISLASLAILVAIFQDDLRSTPPSKSSWFSTNHEKNNPDYVGLTYFVLGIIASVLTVISFLEKEHYYVFMASGTLALIAISWNVIIATIIVITSFILIINFLSQ